MNWLKKNVLLCLLVLALIGFADSAYLTYEHYAKILPPCSTSVFVDCGKVLHSKYALVFGIPLALFGVGYYLMQVLLLRVTIVQKNSSLKKYLLILSTAGFLFSLYFVYLQLVILKAICLYCMVSALTSTLLFILSINFFEKDRVIMITGVIGYLYKKFLKPIFFALDPEAVHEFHVSMGETFGNIPVIKTFFKFLFTYQNPLLSQQVAGATFSNPVGLAAGFDYDARLTSSLSMLGFGFQSVGTVTYLPYKGNPRPMLGRLPKSLSLMVNKGFKSRGAESIAEKLTAEKFEIPVGISIGRSNNAKLTTQKESIKDIMSSFRIFEKARIKNAYYELNISCPNLIHGSITFYPSRNLEELLKAVDRLKLTKPVFIKMPIEKSNKETLTMLSVIVKHNITGVIFGNLQKDRKNKALIPEEVKKFKVGNFSGKPTFKRSNELISLTYKKYKDRLIIIGCGGVFSAEDAYEKIRRGATLVQLITGMIFEGPQLISQINQGLVDLLNKRGFTSISQAIGSKYK